MTTSDKPKTLIARVVGPTGNNLDLKMYKATEWDEDQIKEGAYNTFREAFGEEPSDYGHAVLPYIEGEEASDD